MSSPSEEADTIGTTPTIGVRGAMRSAASQTGVEVACVADNMSVVRPLAAGRRTGCSSGQPSDAETPRQSKLKTTPWHIKSLRSLALLASCQPATTDRDTDSDS